MTIVISRRYNGTPTDATSAHTTLILFNFNTYKGHITSFSHKARINANTVISNKHDS